VLGRTLGMDARSVTSSEARAATVTPLVFHSTEGHAGSELRRAGDQFGPAASLAYATEEILLILSLRGLAFSTLLGTSQPPWWVRPPN
jgi:hypothetical protein